MELIKHDKDNYEEEKMIILTDNNKKELEELIELFDECRSGYKSIATDIKSYECARTELWLRYLLDKAEEEEEENKQEDSVSDPVNHPSHYTRGKYEVIEFIKSKECLRKSFCLGNAVKYLSRAGYKDPSKKTEDLNKALWYIKSYTGEVGFEQEQFDDIPVGEYLQDKGLKGTIRGIVMSLLCNGCTEEAGELLEMALNHEQTDDSMPM